MKLFAQTITATAIAATAALSCFAAPVRAFSVTLNNNPSDLLKNLLGDTTGMSNFSVTTTGNAAAFGLFKNDPFGLKSGIVLSTGTVTDLPGTNTVSTSESPDHIPDLSTDFGADGAEDDSISLDISFDVDSVVEKLYFLYAFGSEEFVEYGGSDFNDSFELLLNGVNLAKLSDGQAVTINNLVPGANQPFHADYIDNPAGEGTLTKLDGFTKMLRFEGLLKQNARNTLSIRIKDVGDGHYDSAVFIQGGSMGTTNPPESVPEPISAIGGLLGLSGMIYRKHQQNKNN